MNQKGFSPILLILGIVVLISITGGAYFLGTQKKNSEQYTQENTVNPTPLSTLTTVPTNQSSQVVTNNKSSPTGQYTVIEERVGDGQTITIKDNKGKVITENVISQNEKEIGYNTKIMCQCGTSFKGWVDNTRFSIKIVNGGGEEYEYLVDAVTGKVDETSFKKLN